MFCSAKYGHFPFGTRGFSANAAFDHGLEADEVLDDGIGKGDVLVASAARMFAFPAIRRYVRPDTRRYRVCRALDWLLSCTLVLYELKKQKE